MINNTVYNYGGDTGVAAIGIFTSYTQLIISFVMGVCMGMQPIVGYNYGAKRYDRLKRAFWLSSLVATVVCILGCLGAQLFPEAISRMFTNDETLVEASNTVLRLTTLAFWAVGFQVVTTNLFQSLGEAGKSIFMSLSRQVVFLMPFLFTLPAAMGYKGVWLSFPSSDVCATIVAVVLLVMQMRKINSMTAQSRQ